MKRIQFISFIIITVITASCRDSIPFRYDPSEPDSLSTRRYPHAFFIVRGEIVDSLTQEPIPGLTVNLRQEDTVLTDSNGVYLAQTVAFPISQEFRMILNTYGEQHNPLYLPETLSVIFSMPTFKLSQDEILEHGPQFFGSAYVTINRTLIPLVHE
ncbi:MAG TPA: hypothetical protein PKY83_05055 [Bacteroidales bacterium]|jgi:hypothetical protein|nr:hypothetical protein [Bacteroidales bacterium]MCZ2417807.1 hypothetical protein [Burkholderiales bacterium]MBP8999933.1 hypothetical protein [Bacteroidales bacterium]MBV6456258.1 hypothetical protein [Bacteroidales bacterium]MCZ2316138.1 hypothetical protein [Bacteroidales bacterium]